MSTTRPMRSCNHVKPWTIKWGVTSSKTWCSKCGTWIHASIDWDGHP